MKKLVMFLGAILFLFVVLNEAQAQSSKANSRSSISVLNGAWVSVAQGVSGPAEHCLYHDGFVTNIVQDSTGQWRDIYSGTYEISGNTYKQKLLYCSNAQLMQATHWQDFKIKGDTLYLTYFKKILDPTGKDVTSQYTPTMNKYVRDKRMARMQ